MREYSTTAANEAEPPVSLSHFAAVLRSYSGVIFLTLLAVAIGYAIIAVGFLLATPSQRVTMQPFRLDFTGAVNGHYPNGMRFSSADIVSTPVLLRVFKDNDLGRFTTFDGFSHAVFVLESNYAYQRLEAEYQARLADAKLSPIDRDRIQKEFEGKAASISKNQFSIAILRTEQTARIPDSVARKVLVDVLNTWAAWVVKEHHVLEYEMSIVSPEAFAQGTGWPGDPIIALQIVRFKVNRIIGIIDDLMAIPGAELLRTKSEKSSLAEIRMHLEELLRFRVEPLSANVRAAGMIPDRSATVTFLETQLAYDQRALKSSQEKSDSIRESLAVYSLDQRALAGANAISDNTGKGLSSSSSGETLIPQVTEGFVDRLALLVNQASDSQYRQRLVDEMRRAQEGVIPLQSAVAYDQATLDQVKGSKSGNSSPDALHKVEQQISSIVGEGQRLVSEVNEIYAAISENINPSRELYTLTAPPTSRMERPRDIAKLFLSGILVLLVSFPVVVIACLLHARVREEEETEARSEQPAAS